MSQKKIMLVAGGTGGHVSPALALSEELNDRNYQCIFVGDKRVRDIYQRHGLYMHMITASAFKKGILQKMISILKILAGIIESFDLLREEKPNLVIGFGGYPSFPTVFAAQLLGIPTVLHEQNSVLGRANRKLLKRAKVLALSFAKTLMIPLDIEIEKKYTGNPVRKIFQQQRQDYMPITDKINILILGGSLGSSLFSTLIPQAIGLLPKTLQERLSIVQQVRSNEIKLVEEFYHGIKVQAICQSYFDDVLSQLNQAHLFIGRSGASTVAELITVGRPALFIPLAISLDGDQANNARQLVENKAAWLLPEAGITPQSVADLLVTLLSDPLILQDTAQNIKSLNSGDAARLLADHIDGMIL